MRLAAGLAGALVLVCAVALEAQGQGGVSLGQTYDWGWGELVYGRTYTTSLTVTNKCRVPRVVQFTISDAYFMKYLTKDGRTFPAPVWKGRENEVKSGQKLPLALRAMLGIPGATPPCLPVPFDSGPSKRPLTCKLLVPPGETQVELTITTPPPPDLSGLVIPPGFDPDTLYDEVGGDLVVDHKGDPPACFDNTEVYLPAGHVHLDPDPAAPSGGGSRCREWWDRERKPAGLTEDCTDEIRDLALSYRRTVLEPLIAQNPTPWGWLPSADVFATMTIEQLIAMKIRARAQIAQ